MGLRVSSEKKCLQRKVDVGICGMGKDGCF